MTEAQAEIQKQAEQLIADALTKGIVVTISLVPTQPLEMSKYDMVADTRPQHPY